MGDNTIHLQAEKMNEIEVMLASLREDEPITLMDKYERVSFEVHLNRAMLGRSLSESTRPKPKTKPEFISMPGPPIAQEGPKQKRAHGLGFRKVLERLIKPIFVRVSGRKEVPDVKDPKIWKAFSKSMRV